MENTDRKLSVVIITKNEENNIGRCLESVIPVADNIVVVDSFSTDKTKDICLKYNVNFIEHEWEGYAKTKNFGNSQAEYDWILSIDADEELSSELQESVLRVKQASGNMNYRIRRRTNYCGKWIRFSDWNPDYKIRLFDRRIAQWEGEYVHEKLVIKEDDNIDVPLLKGDCNHYSVNSIHDHVSQVNKFSSLAAMKMHDKGKKPGFVRLFLSPVIKFIKSYFIRGGFRDGMYGFVISVISAYARFLRIVKLYELRNKNPE